MIQLKISSLDFEKIKENIKDYFKSDQRYSDYNFEGSNLSTLLNILAYNTHYIGYYVKMVLNEAFIDTAQTKEAMISHAKKQGYIIKGKTSAYASIEIEVLDVASDIKFITIPAYTVFNATGENKTTFITTNDYTIKRDEQGKYKLSNVILFQGRLVKHTFVVVEDNQNFVIEDEGCDINTVNVYLRDSYSSTVRNLYSPVIDIIDVKNDSKVWYSNMTTNQSYNIFFGQNKFGKQPEINQYIDIEYISTLGDIGNNINKFIIAPVNSTSQNNIGYYTNIKVNTLEVSHGGVDIESMEELRFSIPNHNRRQKRLVNENDYRSSLIDTFRDVESISVYGGEKDRQRQYAKMIVSVKPYNSDYLSETAKNLIKNNLVRRYGIVGSNIVFVNPEYINLDIDIFVKKNKLSIIQNEQIESEMTLRAEDYNKQILNKFEATYSDSNFISTLREDIDYITSMYTKKLLSKKVFFDKGKSIKYHIVFSNAINNIKSTVFDYGINKGYYASDEDLIYIYSIDGNKLSEVSLGKFNRDTGDIYLQVPRDLYDDSITLTAEPLNADVETTLNNIVRFNIVNVEVI